MFVRFEQSEAVRREGRAPDRVHRVQIGEHDQPDDEDLYVRVGPAGALRATGWETGEVFAVQNGGHGGFDEEEGRGSRARVNFTHRYT